MRLARAKQQVAGDDRDRVAPHRLRARHAPPHLRLVHHVVVVQRREVGDLDRLRRLDDRGVVAGTELRRQERQHGTDALTARFQQIAAGDVGQPIRERHLLEQPGLDRIQTGLDVGREPALVAGGEQRLPEPEGTAQHRAPGEGGRPRSRSPADDVDRLGVALAAGDGRQHARVARLAAAVEGDDARGEVAVGDPDEPGCPDPLAELALVGPVLDRLGQVAVGAAALEPTTPPSTGMNQRR